MYKAKSNYTLGISKAYLDKNNYQVVQLFLISFSLFRTLFVSSSYYVLLKIHCPISYFLFPFLLKEAGKAASLAEVRKLKKYNHLIKDYSGYRNFRIIWSLCLKFHQGHWSKNHGDQWGKALQFLSNASDRYDLE